jgi:hypothetical protein
MKSAGVLAATVGVNDQPWRGLALRDGKLQRCAHQLGCMLGAIAQPTTLRAYRSSTTAKYSYQFVEQLHKKAIPVERLCRVLGVSRSAYYGSRQRARATPAACLVSTQLKAEFAASGRVYGSPRLSAVLRSKGLRLGRHRVRRLMREHRLRALWRRKFVHTTDSGHAPRSVK